MELTQLYGFAGIPVITGLIQMAKKAAPGIPDTIWPIIAVFLALAFNLILGWRIGEDLWVAGIFGLVVGLASSGFYSQTSTYVAKKPDTV